METCVRSKRSGHYFCVLAALLYKNKTRMDWERLWDLAADRGVDRRIAMLAAWVGRLLGHPALVKKAEKFRVSRRLSVTRPAYYSRQSSPYGEEAARLMTPPEVRRWGYWVRMDDDGLKAFLEKHRGG
ncbi:hypothetical protein HY522_02600 [bacterium]|nr:hypothetical protein [bacterium]